MADDDTHANKKLCTTFAEEQLKRILKEKDAVNTRRTTDSSVKTFRAYFREKNGTTQAFEDLPKEDLNKLLSKFYTEAPQENGEQYKKSSLFALRQQNVDLIHDSDFKESNKTFSVVVI